MDSTCTEPVDKPVDKPVEKPKTIRKPPHTKPKRRVIARGGKPLTILNTISETEGIKVIWESHHNPAVYLDEIHKYTAKSHRDDVLYFLAYRLSFLDWKFYINAIRQLQSQGVPPVYMKYNVLGRFRVLEKDLAAMINPTWTFKQFRAELKLAPLDGYTVPKTTLKPSEWKRNHDALDLDFKGGAGTLKPLLTEFASLWFLFSSLGGLYEETPEGVTRAYWDAIDVVQQVGFAVLSDSAELGVEVHRALDVAGK